MNKDSKFSWSQEDEKAKVGILLGLKHGYSYREDKSVKDGENVANDIYCVPTFCEMLMVENKVVEM